MQWLDAGNPAKNDHIFSGLARRLKREPIGLSSPEERAQYEIERTAALAKFDEAQRDYHAKRELSGLNEADRREDILEGASKGFGRQTRAMAEPVSMSFNSIGTKRGRHGSPFKAGETL